MLPSSSCPFSFSLASLCVLIIAPGCEKNMMHTQSHQNQKQRLCWVVCVVRLQTFSNEPLRRATLPVDRHQRPNHRTSLVIDPWSYTTTTSPPPFPLTPEEKQTTNGSQRTHAEAVVHTVRCFSAFIRDNSAVSSKISFCVQQRRDAEKKT